MEKRIIRTIFKLRKCFLRDLWQKHQQNFLSSGFWEHPIAKSRRQGVSDWLCLNDSRSQDIWKKIKIVIFSSLLTFPRPWSSHHKLPLNGLVMDLSTDMERPRICESSLDRDRTSTAHRVKDYFAWLNIGKSEKNKTGSFCLVSSNCFCNWRFQHFAKKSTL